MTIIADSGETDPGTEDGYRRAWVRSYLETRPNAKGVVTGDELEQWYRDVTRATAVTIFVLIL